MKKLCLTTLLLVLWCAFAPHAFVTPQTRTALISHAGAVSLATSQPNAVLQNPIAGQVIHGPSLTVSTNTAENISCKNFEGVHCVDAANTARWAGGNFSAWFQSAVNDACNGVLRGKVVIGVQGTVSISSQVRIPSFCDIGGMGSGKTTLKTAAGSAAGFYPLASTSTSYVLLHDVTIDGNKANQSNTGQGGIKFTSVSNSVISHVEVMNSMGLGASGIQWPSGSDNLIESCDTHDNGSSGTNNSDGIAVGGTRIRVTGNRSRNNTDSGVGLQGNSTADIQIVANKLSGNTLTGIASGANGSPQGDNSRVLISGNKITSNGANIFLQRMNSVVVRGNLLDTTTGTGNKDGLALISVQSASITGNQISHSLGNGILIIDTSAGDSTKNITISSNVITANNASGALLSIVNRGAVLRDVTFSGNTIKANSLSPTNTTDGITVTGSAIAKLVIQGNTLADDQGSPTQRYGLAFGGSPTQVRIGGNLVYGNATGSYSSMPTGAHTEN